MCNKFQDITEILYNYVPNYYNILKVNFEQIFVFFISF